MMTYSFYLDNSPSAVALREHRYFVEARRHESFRGCVRSTADNEYITTISMWAANIHGVVGDPLPMLRVERVPDDIYVKIAESPLNSEDLLDEHYRSWIWFKPTRQGWNNAWFAARQLADGAEAYIAAGPVVAFQPSPTAPFDVIDATGKVFLLDRTARTTDPETFFNPPSPVGFSDVEVARQHVRARRRFMWALKAARQPQGLTPEAVAEAKTMLFGQETV